MEKLTFDKQTINSEQFVQPDERVVQPEKAALPPYQKPNIRTMDEKEVLSAFQVTVAGITWWG
jgi:hypothetical protein